MATGDLKRLQERHEAFWRGEGDTPLKRVTTHVPLKKLGSIPLSNGRRAEEGQYITPDLIDPQQFFGTSNGQRQAVNGDFIRSAGPPHLCWTEAVLGCPIRVVTGGPWAESFDRDWTDIGRGCADERWLEKLDAFVDLLAARANGAYPIVQPLMRGPVDMMASAVGHEPMCMALMEAPEASEAFLDVCAELFIQTANRRLAHTPRFEGGYISSYGIWAPGTVVRTQLDNATMLSPQVYRERVLRYDCKVMEAFDFPLIHVHSGCLHIADELLQIEALKAIQVSLDYPGGPLAAEVLPIFERIIQKKPLIVTGPLTRAELDDLEALSPPGRLCLQVQIVA